MAEALDALSTQASAGRLVVVISHMLAVAQHVTSLIRVTRSPTGSSLRWATEAELVALADAADGSTSGSGQRAVWVPRPAGA